MRFGNTLILYPTHTCVAWDSVWVIPASTP